MINNDLELGAFAPTKPLAYIFDSVLTIVMIILFALFVMNGMTWLVVCTTPSLALSVVSFTLVSRGPDPRFIIVNTIGIVITMVSSVAFLGTECGFQLYVFGFLASTMALSISAENRDQVSTPTKLSIVLLAVFYIAISVWFRNNTPLYSFDDENLVFFIFILNSVVTMASVVFFTGVYMFSARVFASRLSEVALHDALTGLLNRHGFFPIIKKAYERVGQNASVCSIAMLDIDHFKEINDTYGHDAGDAVLKHLADLFQGFMNEWPGLQIARWGGEEFLILYETDGLSEEKPFEPLREHVQNTSITFEGVEIRCTVTIGVADCVGTSTLDGAISLSDKRLYGGKQRGRNTVVYD